MIILIAAALLLFYKWSISSYDYFAKQGMVFCKPVPLFGNFSVIITRKQTFQELIEGWYGEFSNEK